VRKHLGCNYCNYNKIVRALRIPVRSEAIPAVRMAYRYDVQYRDDDDDDDSEDDRREHAKNFDLGSVKLTVSGLVSESCKLVGTESQSTARYRTNVPAN
jgi:hypothetical protein